MKKIYLLIALAFSYSFITKIQAQTYDDPVAYMQAIDNAYREMNEKNMAYMSAAGHGRRARKIEKLRIQTLQTIENTRNKLIDLPLYKGDNSYRKSSIDYAQFCYNIFNEDYKKIVNLEDIAEQSVDEMQAYLLLQEETNKKYKEATAIINQAEKDFAKKYNINLVEHKDELGDKLEVATKLTHYANQVYILFFKCNWEENQLTQALNNKKITQAEQARNALITYANEGLQLLNSDSLKDFQMDPALAQQCRIALTFYKKVGEKDVPKMLDYFLKRENFDKIKNSMDTKSNRTQQDVDTYNAAVREMNKGVDEFNQINQNLNSQKNQLVNNWEVTEKSFIDAHMPYYKK